MDKPDLEQLNWIRQELRFITKTCKSEKINLLTEVNTLIKGALERKSPRGFSSA